MSILGNRNAIFLRARLNLSLGPYVFHVVWTFLYDNLQDTQSISYIKSSASYPAPYKNFYWSKALSSPCRDYWTHFNHHFRSLRICSVQCAYLAIHPIWMSDSTGWGTLPLATLRSSFHVEIWGHLCLNRHWFEVILFSNMLIQTWHHLFHT